MSNPQRSRQPQGSPEGGQFSATPSSESDASLSAPAKAIEAFGADRFVETVHSVVASTYRARGGNIHDQHTMEELSSEVNLRFMLSSNVEIQKSLEGFVYGIARKTVADHLLRGHRRCDIQARAILSRRIEEFAAENHRRPTGAEVTEIATEIRDNWDTSSKHGRPSEDFHTDGRFIDAESINAPLTNADGTFGDRLVAGEPAIAHDGASELIESIEQSRNGGGGPQSAKRAVSHATEELWDTLAAAPGASPHTPKVSRAHIGNDRASNFRKAVAQYPGGVLGIAAAWETGEDNAHTDALFAPFEPDGSPLSDDERQGVIDALYRHRRSAPEIWRAAMQAASRRKSRAEREAA